MRATTILNDIKADLDHAVGELNRLLSMMGPLIDTLDVSDTDKAQIADALTTALFKAKRAREQL